MMSPELAALLAKTKNWGPGVYTRLCHLCNGYYDDGKLTEITTVEQLRDVVIENGTNLARFQCNYGLKTHAHLLRLLRKNKLIKGKQGERGVPM